ncbi:MAG: tetratricopeptide repeat protein [Alphaproteobacteria bacterium]
MFKVSGALQWRCLIAALALVALAGCSSKEDRYARHIKRGEEFARTGNYAKASLEFRAALQIKPVSVEANYQLGLVAEQVGDLLSARVYFSKAIDQDPHNVPALLHEGRIDLVANDTDNALQRANAVLAADQQNWEGHALKGAALLRTDALDDAEKEALQSLRLKPQNPPAIGLLAGLRVKQGRADEALALLADGIKANPNDAGLQLTKITILDQQGQHAQAIDALADLVKANPKTQQYRLDLVRRLVADRDLSKAEQLLREGATLNSSDPTAELTLVEFLKQYKGIAAAEQELAARAQSAPKELTYQFALADLEFTNGQKEQARQILQSLVDRHDEDATGLKARVALARFAVSDGKIAEAQDLATKVIKSDAANGDALLLRAAIRLSQSDYTGSIADIRIVLRDAPDSKPAMALLARAYQASGETDLANEAFQRALDESPEDTALRTEYASALMQSGQAAEADRQLALALQQSPGSASALLARAGLLIAEHRLADAQAIADQLAATPASQNLAHSLSGRILTAEGKLEDAVNEFTTALASEPGSVGLVADLAFAYMRAGHPDLAETEVRALVAAKPNDADASRLLGKICASVGKPQDAKAAYERSIAIDPTNVQARLDLAQFLESKSDYPSAVAALTEGLKARPNNVDMLRALAIAHDYLNNYDAARSAYEQVLKQRPRDLIAANNLAVLIADGWPKDRQLLDEARRLAEQSRNSGNPGLLDTLGWVEYRLGNFDDAVALLRRAAAGAPNEAQIHYHLGLAYLASGDRARAKPELTIAATANAPYRGLDQARKLLAGE